MRTVFSNSMCAHVWAQLTQPHGRSGSMRFDGSVAYSYAEPVAHIMERPDGSKIALFTSRKWSVTTSGHVSDYRSAARQYEPFTVPQLFTHRYHTADIRANEHKENLEYLCAEYTKERDALLRCPADSWRLRDSPERGAEQPTDVHHALFCAACTLESYCEAFGIKCDPLPWRADADKAIARRDRILNDPKLAAKREAARLARERAEALKAAKAEAARIARLADKVTAWRNGAPEYPPYEARHAADGSAMLRLNRATEVVETSLGAEAPLDHVRNVLRFYDCLRKHNREYDGNSATGRACLVDVTLGHFRLDKIDADGNVRAGCHFITAREIAEFRALLV